MITQLLRKQLEAELELIYLNLYEFVKRFFSEVEAEMADANEMTFYIAFQNHAIYTQRYWLDAEESRQVLEQEIDYDEYNEWCKAVT